jgi:putative ABC transport system substrate-binding protein
MAINIARRKFIAALGSAAVACPLAARAQQPGGMRRVSLLLGLADGPEAKTRVRAFQLGLRDLGWIEGRNVAIDYRYGSSDLGLISQYANELVGLSYR